MCGAQVGSWSTEKGTPLKGLERPRQYSIMQRECSYQMVDPSVLSKTNLCWATLLYSFHPFFFIFFLLAFLRGWFSQSKPDPEALCSVVTHWLSLYTPGKGAPFSVSFETLGMKPIFLRALCQASTVLPFGLEQSWRRDERMLPAG